ncbi:hypothetical protein AB1E18_017996 [Capra hircus]
MSMAQPAWTPGLGAQAREWRLCCSAPVAPRGSLVRPASLSGALSGRKRSRGGTRTAVPSKATGYTPSTIGAAWTLTPPCPPGSGGPIAQDPRAPSAAPSEPLSRGAAPPGFPLTVCGLGPLTLHSPTGDPASLTPPPAPPQVLPPLATPASRSLPAPAESRDGPSQPLPRTASPPPLASCGRRRQFAQLEVQTSASFAAIFWRALWYQAALGLKRPHAGLVGRGTGHGCPRRAPARDPQAKPPPRSFPEGVPRQGPAAAGPSEKRGRVERRSPTSDPSGAPRITGSSGRKLSAARARRPAGRMTKFGRAPRRRLPFMAHSPAADVAARGPRPRGCGHG